MVLPGIVRWELSSDDAAMHQSGERRKLYLNIRDQIKKIFKAIGRKVSGLDST